MSSLTYIQALVLIEYKENGYLDMWTKGRNNQEQKIYDIAELSLIMTEVSELIEYIRKGKKPDDDKYCYELAEIIIKTLNYCSRKGINIEKRIIEKNAINCNRVYLHGKEV